LSEIYLVVVLVIALLGGVTNRYKQIQICIKDSIPASINLTLDSFFGHMGLPYIKSLTEVKNPFIPLKAMAYSNQVTHSSSNDPPYQPPSYIYNFPYMSLQVDISAG
jgi:hypothetical protein